MDNRRKRLLFRARHMGTNENDLLFGSFAEAHLGLLPDSLLDQFETLLGCNDPDLFAWVSGSKPVPSAYDNALMILLKQHRLPTAPQ